METQGPPPPTSSYAYMHPAYMQSPHYGPLTFDPTHSMYRGMNPVLMTAAGHYPSSPYLHHPQMRYHVPQSPADLQADLSPKMHQSKAMDLLHQRAYLQPSHKIHELQEHAIKSPSSTGASASGGGSQATSLTSTKLTDTSSVATAAVVGKTDPLCITNHDRRSPPLQRHLHTHHHTHVGVTYPMIRYEQYGGGKPLVRH